MDHNHDDVVMLDVGGVRYTTTKSTLVRYPNNMLHNMFSGSWQPAARDANGTYIIDRDGPTFRHVLNFLRQGELKLPEEFTEWSLLESEAKFYQVTELINAISKAREDIRREAAMAAAAAAAKAKAEEARAKARAKEVEFIEITANVVNCAAHGNFKYTGSPETLKSMPKLLELLVPFGPPDEFDLLQEGVLEDVRESGEAGIELKYEDLIGFVARVDRLKVFQEVTQTGFSLVQVSTSSMDGESEKWLFSRAVNQ